MSQRVLVVDDDPSIRELVAEALEEDGYEVLTAETAQWPSTSFDESTEGATWCSWI